MIFKPLKFILISTPIGSLGSGKGGGVELTLVSVVKGLLEIGHQVVLVAPKGSYLPSECKIAEVIEIPGMEQLSWQHQNIDSSISIPVNGVLPKMLDTALHIGKDFDAILNFSYVWLPLWVTSHVEVKLFHLISMGLVSKAMGEAVRTLSKSHHSRLAFHTFRQASDYELTDDPFVLGNGFDLKNYSFQSSTKGPLGWAGRVAKEKGLEDAAKVASLLGEQLNVWGVIEDKGYASEIESLVPNGTIKWRGFLKTEEFQKELGSCRAFINTPKWNEAYGNVVMEAMACGVPVISYDRGGPGELIKSGLTGWIVPPDDVDKLSAAVLKIDEIERQNCRDWAIKKASYQSFANRIVAWIVEGIKFKK